MLRKGKHMRTHNPASDPKFAESLAIQALSFLAAEPERLSRFFALTGIDPVEIRQLARERTFLAAVLEHICGDDRLQKALASELACSPAAIDRARQQLAGQDWERDTA
jgi:LPS sulfotransferase NodH